MPRLQFGTWETVLVGKAGVSWIKACPLTFPSTKYKLSLKQNCPGWFSSLLKSASNLFKCLVWEWQETGLWTLPTDRLPGWTRCPGVCCHLRSYHCRSMSFLPRQPWCQAIANSDDWCDLSPWAGKSLEPQLVQASPFTTWNKDISKVTQAASRKHRPPRSQVLRIGGFQQDLSVLTLSRLGLDDLLSCALQVGQQRPFSLPIRCLQPQLWQPKLSLDIAKYPQTGKVTPSWEQWLRARIANISHGLNLAHPMWYLLGF